MQNLNQREQYCLDNAAYFTAIRGNRPATRERVELPTIEAAKTHAAKYGDGRTMIYAVTKCGAATHLINC